jgi:nucleoside-diphosphate-sugar epimerase
MVISILGCGWYGKALAKQLMQNSIIVKGSATSNSKLEDLRAIGVLPYVVKFETDSEVFDGDFFGCDILIVSIPPKSRSQQGGSYLHKIESIIKAIALYEIKKVIYISSTGVYSDRNNEVNELDLPRPDTEAGTLLLAAEHLFQNQASFATTIIRFGGLVGPGRHPGRFFAGKTNIPNGLAPVNLIHQLDCVGITMAIITQNAFGYVFNACSPSHPTKAIFYSEMALNANLPAPQFINEQKKWKLVNSINLAELLKYDFRVKDWFQAGLFD